jgi:hypothetical protein
LIFRRLDAQKPFALQNFRLRSLASSSDNDEGGKNRFLTFICSRCTVVEPTGLIMLLAFHFETYPYEAFKT